MDNWEIKKAIIKRYKDDPLTTGGRDRLYQHIRFSEKPEASQISRRDVARFLSEDSSHQIHRPLNKRLTVRPILVAGPALVVQIDLVDMQSLAGKNAGVRYLLTYVDLFSKFAQVRTMPNKTQKELVKQLLDILENLPKNWRPRTIQADNGSEFQSQMEKALMEMGIKTIHSAAYQPRTQGAVERYNRSIKSDIYQLMTRNKTERYIDWLVPLVTNYNNTKHSTTGEAPLEVMEAIPLKPEILAIIRARMERRLKPAQDADTFEVGQKVRVALNTESGIRKMTFRKAIKNNWSATLFEIYAISQPTTANTQPQYLLKNLDSNRRSTKRYWAYQLQDATNADEPEEEEEQNDRFADASLDEEELPRPAIAPRVHPQRERVPVARVIGPHGERINF